jgi:hypothetical protein
VEYTVRVPDHPGTFYRLVEGDDAATLERSFLSNHDASRPRRRRVEDAADHRGISVRETLDQALSLAVYLNEVRRGRRVTHVAEFSLDPKERYACASTGTSEGHQTVWGEAAELASDSSIVALHPIDRKWVT